MAPKAKAGGGSGDARGGTDGGADNLTVEQQQALAEQERLTQKAYDNQVRQSRRRWRWRADRGSTPALLAQSLTRRPRAPQQQQPQVIAKAPPLNNLEPLPIANGKDPERRERERRASPQDRGRSARRHRFPALSRSRKNPNPSIYPQHNPIHSRRPLPRRRHRQEGPRAPQPLLTAAQLPPRPRRCRARGDARSARHAQPCALPRFSLRGAPQAARHARFPKQQVHVLAPSRRVFLCCRRQRRTWRAPAKACPVRRRFRVGRRLFRGGVGRARGRKPDRSAPAFSASPGGWV